MSPVPVAVGVRVVPAVVVAVSVKASEGSIALSLFSGVRTSSVVMFGAKVALVASSQVVPPSVETCRLLLPVLP